MKRTINSIPGKYAHAAMRALSLAVLVSTLLVADQPERLKNLPEFMPVLAETKARAFQVDPQKGYLVQEIKPNLYVITDGMYQSAFVTTGKGVILFDAPPSFAAQIVKAVAEVTKEPIVELVYSHTHVDHTAGASLLVKQIPRLQILAEREAAAYLNDKFASDPRRPVPTVTFTEHKTLKLGSATVEWKKGHWHSSEGDLFIYFPQQKALMAIDTIAPDYVPFQDFDLTTNMYQYLKVFDQLSAYDFDTLIAGHLTSLGNRQDVETSKAYAMDVYETVKRIHNGANQMQLLSEGAAKYGWDNKFALFRTVLDAVREQATKEIQGRWKDRLASVDIYTDSHCRAMLTYVRWDD